MSRNQVAGGIPSNRLEASVHHTRGEAGAIDRIRAEDTNALGGQRPGGVVAAHRYRCW